MANFKLSPQQRRLWQLHSAGLGTHFQCQSCIGIWGELDVRRLQQVLQGMVDRLEILRTTFRLRPESTSSEQMVADGANIALAEYDLSGLAPAKQWPRLMELGCEMKRISWNAEQMTSISACLVRFTLGQHYLLLSGNPFCFDESSLTKLVEEVCSSYAGFETIAVHHEEILQYPDFSEWQDSVLFSSDSAIGISYWYEQQRHFSESVEFGGENFKPGSFKLRMEEYGEDFRKQCQRRNISPRLLLQVAWQTVLSRITGEKRIALGVDYDGRNYDELRNCIGLIGRTLPVLLEFKKGATSRSC